MLSKNKIIISFAVLTLFMVIMPVISNATTQTLITDENLLATIFDVNGDKVISENELKKIYYLQIWEGVKDLSGLEYATNIRKLFYEYDGTQLDFSKMKLDEITTLVIALGEGGVDFNLDFLSNFPRLKKLEIVNNGEKNIDLSKLTNYQNIQELVISRINISDMSVISNMKNLEYLEINTEEAIDLTGIEKLSNLKSLRLAYAQVQNATGIGSLSNLEDISVFYCTGFAKPDYMKNNTNLRKIDMDGSDLEDISFASNLEQLECMVIYSTKVSSISSLKNLPNLKSLYVKNSEVTEAETMKLLEIEDITAYVGERKYVSSTMQGLLTYDNWEYKSSNESVATVGTSGAIIANQVGEATITMTNKITNDVKSMKVTVVEDEITEPLGNEMTSTIISDNLLLKANGELWKIYENVGKAELIDTNIAKYVSDFVYASDQEATPYILKMKNDGSAQLEFNGVVTQLENVKDIREEGYLTKDGVYYELLPTGKFQKVMDNVEKIIGKYLIGNDGITYTAFGRKACDFKIIAAVANTVVDENNVVWKQSASSVTVYKWDKIGENFKQYTDMESGIYAPLYETEDGILMTGSGKETEYRKEISHESNKIRIDKQQNALLNDAVILSDVSDVHVISSNKIIIIRLDGSMWCLKLNGEAKLEKITEQNEGVFIQKDSLKVKNIVLGPIGENMDIGEALTGFDIANLKVNNIVSNFNGDYNVKVYKEDSELTGDDKISTGSIIKLYDETGKQVKEYVAIVYGDVTGTGNPGAKDALAIIKNKTGKVAIQNTFALEAARVTENTRKIVGTPNASDALAIIKAKLGKYTISI